MKRNIALLAVLWVAIAAVWYGGFHWESWIAAPQVAERAAEPADDEPILYVLPDPGEKAEEKAPDPEPVSRETPEENPEEIRAEVPEEISDPPVSAPEEGTVYVVNTKTKKIHLPSCSSVADIKDTNRGETDDPEALLAEGYAWCKRCHG